MLSPADRCASIKVRTCRTPAPILHRRHHRRCCCNAKHVYGHPAGLLSPRIPDATPQPAAQPANHPRLRLAQVKTQALSNTILVISGATAASLALGRFVLLPVQRGFSEKAGPPKQNGIPYPEAGDS